MTVVIEPEARPEQQLAGGASRRWLSARGALRFGVVVLVGVIAAFSLRGRLPDPGEVADAFLGADTRWMLVAVLATFVSMAMFALQQRRLLTAFGVTLPRHRALALSYSRSAMSISLPAGSAVSAAYAFRQFRAGGADRCSAASVLVLSGVLSTAGLVVLYAIGVLASAVLGASSAWHAHSALIIGACTVLVATIGLLVRFASRSIKPRHWVLALAAATANWSTDLLCLVAVASAFDMPLELGELGAVYLTVQIVRQIPLTPGGIGVVEASLLAGLVSAGGADAAAAATVLTYRVLSCWLIIPIGLLGWLVLRRPGRVLPIG